MTPRDAWLLEHKPVSPFGALEAGRMLIASHGGNVWLALHSEPHELRLEILLAYFADSGDYDTLLKRVDLVRDFLQAIDDAEAQE